VLLIIEHLLASPTLCHNPENVTSKPLYKSNTDVGQQGVNSNKSINGPDGKPLYTSKTAVGQNGVGESKAINAPNEQPVVTSSRSLNTHKPECVANLFSNGCF
jgi:hypothetical protein